MKELFESFRRGLIVCLGSAIFLITASLALSPLSEAGTDAVTHRSAPAMPPGMRRVTVTSKPSGSVSGAFTLTVNRVPGPDEASAKPHRRNSASAMTAASYNEAAATSTACSKPSESVNETRQARHGTLTV